ncbi:MAG TPA: mannonate dehydratase [Bryobacteraceae bacterium]|nr:mannonate dehydratase [Bryobacteraceae bacterium]
MKLAFLLAGFGFVASVFGQSQAGTDQIRPALGIRVVTDEVLKLAVQLGVRDVVIYGGPASGFVPGTSERLTTRRASYEQYLALRKRLEGYGIRLAAIEGGFVHSARYSDIVFGGPKRDELIAELADEIRDMGRAGVPIYGYHWMPTLVWRTSPVKIRGAANATAFDYEQVRHVRDRASCEEVRKKLNWFLITCETIPDRRPTEEEMWNNLEYWIRKITPVAEQAGIRLGIHPDDPPVSELAGVPRLMRNHSAYKRLIEIYPSASNAIEFCQGTFSEMTDDIYEAIRYFASRDRILYVHFRNVSATVPSFHEEFINTGHVDMHRALRLYKENGFRGVVIDDHVPMVAGDTEFPGNLGGYRGRMYTLGYIQAMLDVLAGGR